MIFAGGMKDERGRAKMEAYERVLMTLAHKEPDRVPFDLGGTESTAINVKTYRELRRYLGLPEKEPKFLSFPGQLAQPDEDFCRLWGIDTRRITRRKLSGWEMRLEEDAENFWFIDEWGVTWRMPKQGGHYFDMVSYPLKGATFEEIRQFKWPDGRDPALVEGLTAEAEELFATTRACLVLDARIGNGFLHTGALLEGYEDFLVDLAVSPARAEYILDRVLELKMQYWDLLLTAVGDKVHVVRELDDLGGQNGLLISLAMYRRYIKPRQKALFDFIKQKAPHVKILFHSCGSVYDLIPDLIEVGVDILNPVQVSAAKMDTARLKKEFGHALTFWGGGIDTQRILPYGTPQEVKEEVKRRLDDLAPGGGFVFATVHSIEENVPPENIVAMWEALQEYGVYR